jgi:hypothetical protein
LKELTIEIHGRPWKFVLMPDRRFDRLHNPENEGNVAMTVPNQYEVHFRKSDWCVRDIRHELGHVLMAMAPTVSAGLDPIQVEETMCDIYSDNYSIIGFWTDRIAEKFFDRE